MRYFVLADFLCGTRVYGAGEWVDGGELGIRLEPTLESGILANQDDYQQWVLEGSGWVAELWGPPSRYAPDQVETGDPEIVDRRVVDIQIEIPAKLKQVTTTQKKKNKGTKCIQD